MTVLPELKIYRCYVLRGVFVAQFQDLEDFSFVLSLSLQGLNVRFDGRDWGKDSSGVRLRSGVCELGSICSVNVLRVENGLIVLAGAVARLSASQA